MASSSKKKPKSKTAAKASSEAEVVDAVVIEDEAPAGDAVMDTVDEMADADGVSKDAADVAEDVTATTEDVAANADDAATEIAEDGVEEVSDAVVETTEDVSDALVPVAAVEPAPERSNPFWPMVLGGLVAACLGFLFAKYLAPEEWLTGGNAELEAKVEAQAETINGLNGALDEASATAAAQAEALGGQITEAVDQNTAQAEQISELEAKLAALTEQVNTVPELDDAELSADLRALLVAQKNEISTLQEDLREMAQFAEGQIETAQQEAEAAARAEARAKARDRLNTVRLALASGEAFDEVLPEIAEAAEIPAALSDVASGVTTQSALQGSFGSVARAALAASNRELAGDSAGDRVGLFLQDMIGARSLTPQDGDSPDAVLSRAEASVQNGDLAAAIETLDALPEGGKAELTEWSGMAKARNDALQAFSDLTDALSAD